MSAEGIFANLAFSIPLGITMFLLFMLLRRKLPIFYHRNILVHGRLMILGSGALGSFAEWFRGLMALRDEECLRLGGLDSLVLISTFRLILITFCIMAVPCLLLLVPFYYTHSDTSDGVDFNTFTIADLYTESFWPPLIVLTFLTALVLYAIYSFYANYIRLRQAFLLRPSGLNSVGGMLTVAEAFGSIKDARKRIDSSTCTVLLHPIPPDIPPQNLHKILNQSGIKGIKSVQFIGDYEKVSEIMKKRNSSLKKLEAALKSVTDKLEKSKKDSSSNEPIPLKESSSLLNQLISDVEFCSKLRPRHKTSKPAQNDPEPVDRDGRVDSIRHFYKKLIEREDELQTALNEFNSVPKQAEAEESPPEDKSFQGDFEKRYIDETTFISWEKVTKVSENLSSMSILDSSQAALLHLSDYREACRAQQILLTSRPNAMESKMAPGVDDINWKFIGWSHRQRWRGAFKSNLFYWIFVIVFAPIVAAVVAFIDMESLGKWIPAIETFRTEHPQVRSILEGVLAPFCATLLMKRTGIWIAGILLPRGPISKSELALKLQGAHLFFLFIQVIFIGAIFSNVYEFTVGTIVNNFQLGAVAGHLRENLPKKAHFFFNFMIQDICNELMLELLNPKSLFFDRSFLSESARKAKSIRGLFKHDINPPELEPAIAWSRFIMFPFFIVMIYIITAPLIVIPAIAYYSVAYFVYRFRYAHYGRVSVDTGGLFWRHASQQMIYALILCQFAVFLQYTQFRKGFLPGLIILGLFCISAAFIPFLKLHFGKILDSISVLEDDVKESKKTVQSLLHSQNELLPRAVKYLENAKLVESKLESDLRDHFNFSDIDPLIASDSDRIENNIIPNDNSTPTEDFKSLFQSYWSIIPLKVSEEQAQASFDPFHVDNFVDLQYVRKQYEHPLILKHTQILMVPRDLPMLLKKENEQYKQ